MSRTQVDKDLDELFLPRLTSYISDSRFIGCSFKYRNNRNNIQYKRIAAKRVIISFAGFIWVVTQRSSPANGCSLERCIPFLKLTNREQPSISWKPGPLAANVTRNIIGVAANSYMHVVGSQ